MDDRRKESEHVQNDVRRVTKDGQKSDDSQQSLLRQADQVSYASQQQQMDQEFDPFRTVRSFHRRQRELIDQSPMLTTPPFNTGEEEQAQTNYIGSLQETPKPQRERNERHWLPEKGTTNLTGNNMEEISYIPREIHSTRLPKVPEENVNQLELTSFMHLPWTGQEDKTCGKCGEQGHVRRQCRAIVSCDLCKTRLHATMACRTYTNFVREHLLTLSRKNTPEKFHNEQNVDQEVARRVEIQLRRMQKERDPIGEPPLPQPRRQYLPVSSQDVRVQMGAQVHTEVHQPKQRKVQQMFDPQRFQPTIKANNCFIGENSRGHKKQSCTMDRIVITPDWKDILYIIHKP